MLVDQLIVGGDPMGSCAFWEKTTHPTGPVIRRLQQMAGEPGSQIPRRPCDQDAHRHLHLYPQLDDFRTACHTVHRFLRYQRSALFGSMIPRAINLLKSNEFLVFRGNGSSLSGCFSCHAPNTNDERPFNRAFCPCSPFSFKVFRNQQERGRSSLHFVTLGCRPRFEVSKELF